jgi:MFS-type transporter involved in bile tolerance (Atg22 family)
VIRSLLSKIVPKTDLGKVFSILSSLESAAPLLISPIIVTIYKATIDHFAGTIFIVFATLYLLVTLCLIVVYVVLKRPNGGYDQLHNEVQHVPEQDSSVAA